MLGGYRWEAIVGGIIGLDVGRQVVTFHCFATYPTWYVMGPFICHKVMLFYWAIKSDYFYRAKAKVFFIGHGVGPRWLWL